MFRLDEDLSAFYLAVGEDAELHWCATGAGRSAASVRAGMTNRPRFFFR